MKTVKEIKKEADTLYQKSSHYIAETFIAIGAVVAIAKGMLEIVGVHTGIEYLFLLSVLFSPLELGMIKASLMAFDRRAKEVKTTEYTFMGLTNYFKIFVPFVGRTLIVYVLEALILAVFVYVSMGSFEMFAMFLESVLAGNLGNILSNKDIVLTVGTLSGVVVTLISAFVIDAYFSLSYYFVVEDDMSLSESISASIYCMNGNIGKYIGIKLQYIVPTIIAAIAVNFVTIAFQTLFQQLLTIVAVPLIIFNVMLVVITAFVSSFISVMLYKVKETLAYTVFYRDLKDNYYE